MIRRRCEVEMSEEVEGEGSKPAFVGDVTEHIRRCHERIVVLHTGARALIQRVHRDLQIARECIQQAEAKATAEKARADAAEAKFQQLAWLVRSQLLPAIEDEGLHSFTVTHMVQPSPAAREPSPEQADDEHRALEYSVGGRLLEYRTGSQGRCLSQIASLRHRIFADLVQLSMRHLRMNGPFRSRPVFHLPGREARFRLPEQDRSAS